MPVAPEITQEIDDALDLHTLPPIRLASQEIAAIDERAKAAGLVTQAYVRNLLRAHLKRFTAPSRGAATRLGILARGAYQHSYTGEARWDAVAAAMVAALPGTYPSPEPQPDDESFVRPPGKLVATYSVKRDAEPQPKTEDEREAFEQWVRADPSRSRLHPPEREEEHIREMLRGQYGATGYSYFMGGTQWGWKAWQARATLAATAQAPERDSPGDDTAVEKAWTRFEAALKDVPDAELLELWFGKIPRGPMVGKQKVLTFARAAIEADRKVGHSPPASTAEPLEPASGREK